MNINRSVRAGSMFIIGAAFLLAGAARAEAASLYFSPDSKTYGVDQVFTVNVLVSTDKAMNAAAGVISFSKDLLDVQSVSKAGSVMTLWAEEPTASNSTAQVRFEGVALNPGYIGGAGKIVTVTFRTKAAGTAKLSFASGSVLANDGKGTNIIEGLGTATYVVSGAAKPVVAPPVSTGADTAKPKGLVLSLEDRTDPTDPIVKIDISAEDAGSGISYFEIQLNGDSPEIIKSSGKAVYTTKPLGAGVHSMVVRAFDKSGNVAVESITFAVRPLAIPVITYFPKELSTNAHLIVQGKTEYKNATVHVFIAKEGNEIGNYRVPTDEKGAFTFASLNTFDAGMYTVHATVVDARGAQSPETEKKNLVILKPPFIRFGEKAIDYLSVILTAFALLLTCTFVGIYMMSKASQAYRHIRGARKSAEGDIHKSFEAVREDLQQQFSLLDGKPDLSEREKKILAIVMKSLKTVEKKISSRVDKIGG